MLDKRIKFEESYVSEEYNTEAMRLLYDKCEQVLRRKIKW